MTEGLVTPLADATFHRCPLQALRVRHRQTLGALSLLRGRWERAGQTPLPLTGQVGVPQPWGHMGAGHGMTCSGFGHRAES